MKVPFAFWRWSWRIRSHFGGPLELGKPFPDFALKDVQDRGYRLSDRKPGTFKVLWFTNLCEDCRAKIPLLEEVVREGGGKFKVLAVSILPPDDPLPKEVAPKLGFPILLDPEDIVANRLGLSHPPGTCPLFNLFIVDPEGRIATRGHLSAYAPDEFRALWKGL